MMQTKCVHLFPVLWTGPSDVYIKRKVNMATCFKCPVCSILLGHFHINVSGEYDLFGSGISLLTLGTELYLSI